LRKALLLQKQPFRAHLPPPLHALMAAKLMSQLLSSLFQAKFRQVQLLISQEALMSLSPVYLTVRTRQATSQQLSRTRRFLPQLQRLLGLLIVWFCKYKKYQLQLKTNTPRTYPTTYVAYIDFSHIFAVPVSTGCLTATEKLVLPSPTDFASLIFPSASVSESGKPPSTLISYLNSLPTVLVQLSGTPIGSSCDPIVGGTTPQVVSTAVGVVSLTSVPAIDAAISTHYFPVQEDTGKPAPPLGASTPAPPPPSSTAALPQSFAPASSSPAPAPSSALGTSLPASAPLNTPSASQPNSAIQPSLPSSSHVLAGSSLVASPSLGTSLIVISTPGSFSEPNQPSSNPLQATSNAGSGIFISTTTQTSAPPPVPASSTVTVAAAHPRADMRHLGLEGWLIGAAGLGLGWL